MDGSIFIVFNNMDDVGDLDKSGLGRVVVVEIIGVRWRENERWGIGDIMCS